MRHDLSFALWQRVHPPARCCMWRCSDPPTHFEQRATGPGGHMQTWGYCERHWRLYREGVRVDLQGTSRRPAVEVGLAR